MSSQVVLFADASAAASWSRREIRSRVSSGSPYSFQSSYNTTHADVLSQLGSLPVVGVSLIVDSGFAGPEVVDLTSATVGVGGSNP